MSYEVSCQELLDSYYKSKKEGNDDFIINEAIKLYAKSNNADEKIKLLKLLNQINP